MRHSYSSIFALGVIFVSADLFGQSRRPDITGLGYTAEIKVKLSSAARSKVLYPDSILSSSLAMTYWTFGEDFRLEVDGHGEPSEPPVSFIGVAEGPNNKWIDLILRTVTTSTSGDSGMSPSLFAREPLLAPLAFASPDFSLLILSQRPVRGARIESALRLLDGPMGAPSDGPRVISVTGKNDCIATFTFSPQSRFPVKFTLAFADGAKLMDYEVSHLTEVRSGHDTILVPSRFQIFYFDEKTSQLLRSEDVSLTNIIIPAEPIPAMLEIPIDKVDTLYNNDNGRVLDLRASK